MKAANPSSSTMAVDREFLQNHLARDIVNFFHFSLYIGHMMGLDLEVVQDGLRLDKLRHHLILYRLMV